MTIQTIGTLFVSLWGLSRMSYDATQLVKQAYNSEIGQQLATFTSTKVPTLLNDRYQFIPKNSFEKTFNKTFDIAYQMFNPPPSKKTPASPFQFKNHYNYGGAIGSTPLSSPSPASSFQLKNHYNYGAIDYSTPLSSPSPFELPKTPPHELNSNSSVSENSSVCENSPVSENSSVCENSLPSQYVSVIANTFNDYKKYSKITFLSYLNAAHLNITQAALLPYVRNIDQVVNTYVIDPILINMGNAAIKPAILLTTISALILKLDFAEDLTNLVNLSAQKTMNLARNIFFGTIFISKCLVLGCYRRISAVQKTVHFAQNILERYAISSGASRKVNFFQPFF